MDINHCYRVSGFTLIEMLMVSVIGAVVIGGTFNILQVSLQSSQIVKTAIVEQELQIAVARALESNSEQCKTNLRPKIGSVGNLEGTNHLRGIGVLSKLKKGTSTLVESGSIFKNSLEIVKMELTGEVTQDPKSGSTVERTFIVHYRKSKLGKQSTLDGTSCVASNTSGCYFHYCKMDYELDSSNQVISCVLNDCGGVVRSMGGGEHVDCYTVDTDFSQARTLVGCGDTDKITANNTTAFGYGVGGGAGLVGVGNSFFGYYAGASNTTGNSNIFFGNEAGRFNTTGGRNIFLGYHSGRANTMGRRNVFLGYHSGRANTTGDSNTFLGYRAGRFNTTGGRNTFLGYEAGRFNTTGGSNIFLGYWAGASNTIGGRNTFLGYETGRSNTTGDNNTFLGYEAGLSNTGGNSNAFLGYQTGAANTIGGRNTFVGYWAGLSNTVGSSNTFLGNEAGRSNTTGRHNTFLGYEVGASNTKGKYNTFLGNEAGLSNITGDNNTFLGYQAGLSNTVSSNSIIIRAGTTEERSGQTWTWNSLPGSNNILIGSFSLKEEKQLMSKSHYMWVNHLIEGDFKEGWVSIHHNLDAKNLYASLHSISDFRLKKKIHTLESSLDRIKRLRPVSFYWKDKERGETQQMGFIAQEMNQTVPEVVKQDRKGFFTINYPSLVPLIVGSIQEFQQLVNEQLSTLHQQWMEKFIKITDQLVALKTRVTESLSQQNAEIEDLQNQLQNTRKRLQNTENELKIVEKKLSQLCDK